MEKRNKDYFKKPLKSLITKLPSPLFRRIVKLPTLFIIVLVAASTFVLSSCSDKDYIYEESQEITAEKWRYLDTLNYTFQITDTTKIYNIYLELDHSIDYSYQNLYLKMHTQFPSGKRISQQVSFELADKYGQWYGDCGSSSCSLLVPSQKGAYFNAIGQHTITIEQFMRKDPIEGIQGLSVRIEDTGANR